MTEPQRDGDRLRWKESFASLLREGDRLRWKESFASLSREGDRLRWKEFTPSVSFADSSPDGGAYEPSLVHRLLDRSL